MRHLKSFLFCLITLFFVFLLVSCSLAEQFFGQTQTSQTESSDITTTVGIAVPTATIPQENISTTAKKTTITTTTTTAPQRTTTTTVPQKTTVTTTTATASQKTTRRATDAEIDLVRMQVENKYSSQLYEYEMKLQQILDDCRQQLSDLSYQYAVNTKMLREQYANMGMLNSGAYTSALNSLNNQYTKNQNAIREKMQEAQDTYDELESAIYDLIEAEIADEIEKLQQSTLS